MSTDVLTASGNKGSFARGRKDVVQSGEHGKNLGSGAEQLGGNRKRGRVSQRKGLLGKIARLGPSKPGITLKPFLRICDSAFLQPQWDIKENAVPSCHLLSS